ncbi:hypothetical protein [Piscinibacter koreensis]|uniref:Uncharacterized protein n=1 Tax=Piscinibacter koreensis TaxID=2742824 RepID=A0A7Y6TX21_9BURK|nr:hypothetical protein [Schlegelella koreensis]NUZ06678.1 hypothetical protein [Schlegelella koreensis]
MGPALTRPCFCDACFGDMHVRHSARGYDRARDIQNPGRATRMTVPTPSADFEPELVLLLCSDPADAVTRALMQKRASLGWPLIALSAQQLIDGIELGTRWVVDGRRVDPDRTALINRLPLGDRLEPGPATPDATVVRQAVWCRLRDELGRFRYVSSLPTATSIMGCYGSLLDQWQDLPRLVPGLRVPEHSAASVPRALQGRVFAVNRWTPYSLGKPLDATGQSEVPATQRVDYVMPEGGMVHLAQVGDAMFFPNAPPTMSASQRQAMIDIARAFAAVSAIRVLEHALFLGDGPPVLYSSFPVPVMSGGHPLYAQLVEQGLTNDIRKWAGRRAA